MDLILADLQWKTCLVYLDDIIVFGRDFQEHLVRLDQVLEKVKQANLKVEASKCNLFATQVYYLGHVISADGVMPDPAKVEADREWPVPCTQSELQSFLGLASYYRRFIRGFAHIARPLHQLVEKGKRFQWSNNCQVAFDGLKARLIAAPVLAHPDPDKTFILDIDASDVGIGAVLSQVGGLGEWVIAYASRALTKQERKYATTKKELLGMVVFTKHFKHYLLGREFALRTDHNSLSWLHNFQGVEGQLARWVEQLACFPYKIVRPGKLHCNVDALSRLTSTHGEPQSLGQVGLQDQDCQAERRVCSVQVEEGSAGQGCGMDELAQAQADDPVLQLIIFLRSLGRPVAQLRRNVCSHSPMCGISSSFRGPGLCVLLQHTLILPPTSRLSCHSMVPGVLRQLHNVPTGGHLGVQKP
uniref:ribonuclease H n=1 Tax=Nothobranchius furzeri TaxID=105023 RepID=A0A8C6M0S4_NOTFU